MYFEAIDSITSAIKDRFEQQCLTVFSGVEQLLLKSINGEDYQREMDSLLNIYGADIDSSALPSELLILRSICIDGNPSHFDDILTSLQAISKTERSLIPNIVSIVKVVFVSGATTATPERSFSMARRIKTWLRSTMKQRRFNSLSILNSSKPLVDKLPLVKVANEFVEKRPNRRNEFGLFTESDLKTQ